MAASRAHAIDPLGVLAMYRLQHRLQIVLIRRDQHEVNVVRHETVSDDLHVPADRVLSQETQVTKSVAATKENLLAIVASLCNVVRDPRDDEASMARHADTLVGTTTRASEVACANQ